MARLSDIPEGERLPHIYPTEFWSEQLENIAKVEKQVPMKIVTRDENGADVERVENRTVLRDEVQYVNEDFVKWVKKGDTKSACVVKVRLMKKLDPIAWKVIQPYYEKWKKGEEIEQEGTALSNWPLVKSKKQVDQLRLLSIHTVEDLAVISDDLLQNIGMGARELRDKAKAFMISKQGDAKVAVLLQRQDETISKQQAQIDDMTKSLAELTKHLIERPKPEDIAKK